MVADLRRRFWVSLALTVPVLTLAPMIQELLRVREAWALPGGDMLQVVLASVIFFDGGFPFLRGLGEEVGRRGPGMMTLLSLAISETGLPTVSGAASRTDGRRT
jgi:Cu2+-exporting ATPase